METIDSNVWAGVQSLLDSYVKAQPEDHAVILFSSDSADSAAWVSAALELRGIPVDRIWMAPLRDEGFGARLTAALPPISRLNGRRLVVLGFERDTMSHTSTLAAALSPYKNKTIFRAISACADLFSTALRVLPEELSARNASLLSRFMKASRLRITTAGGSDFTVALDAKHRWISNRGLVRPGSVAILPAGEVATFPAGLEGVLVADFAFNVNAISDVDSRLQDHPVTVWLEGGRAVKYECADPEVSRFLGDCFGSHCAFNVGEIGFGTNVAIDNAISMNSHINERRPGVHLGFGQHNQDPGIVDYHCSIHLDLITRGGMVWVDDDDVPLDLENIALSAQAHPEGPRDEDVFSPGTDELEVDDCCGILTGDGLTLFSRS